jgi:hypothetical protein
MIRSWSQRSLYILKSSPVLTFNSWPTYPNFSRSRSRYAADLAVSGFLYFKYSAIDVTNSQKTSLFSEIARKYAKKIDYKSLKPMWHLESRFNLSRTIQWCHVEFSVNTNLFKLCKAPPNQHPFQPRFQMPHWFQRFVINFLCIFVISWRLVLLEQTWVPGENHWQVADKFYHNV